jgi:hypothetical protein
MHSHQPSDKDAERLDLDILDFDRTDTGIRKETAESWSIVVEQAAWDLKHLHLAIGTQFDLDDIIPGAVSMRL